MYPKKHPEITKEDFLKKLEENGCRIYAAVRELGISYKTYYNWRKTDEEFLNNVEVLRQGKTTMIEDELMRLIRDNSNPGIQLRSIMFYLSTQAGWSETKNVKLSTNDTVDVQEAIKDIKNQITNQKI